MHCTITYIRLKSIRQYFALIRYAAPTANQARKAAGNIKVKSTGLWRDHYTLTSWESTDTMRAFAHSGAHMEAMKQSAMLADEIKTHTVERERMPTWKEAKLLLNQHGKVLDFRKQ